MMTKVSVIDLLVKKEKNKSQNNLINYNPKSTNEFIGTKNQVILTRIKEHIKNQDRGIFLLNGNPGTGKNKLCRLILSELNYEIIEFDVIDTYKKDAFHFQLSKMLKIHNGYNVGIIINNVEHSVPEKTFSKVVRIIEKCGSMVPVFCISSCKTLPKVYINKTIYEYIDYPEFDSCINFFNQIVREANINISEHLLKLLVQKCNQKIVKILQILNILHLKKSIITTKKINQMLFICGGDEYYIMSEYMSLLFNYKLSVSSLLENETSKPFSIETFHSNLRYIKDYDALNKLIEVASMTDTIENYIFHHGSFDWGFKKYAHLICTCYLMLYGRPKGAKRMKKIVCQNPRSNVKKLSNNVSRFKLSQVELSWIKKFNLLNN